MLETTHKPRKGTLVYVLGRQVGFEILVKDKRLFRPKINKSRIAVGATRVRHLLQNIPLLTDPKYERFRKNENQLQEYKERHYQ